MAKKKVRAIFISDIHLGTRACQAESLLGFLKAFEAEYLYLVGDIVDFWAMNRSIQWAASHNTVVQKILRRARHGTQVIFVPGNHDELLREYDGIAFGGIQVRNEAVHETVNGKRYWVVHGDEYDQVTRHHRWVAMVGDVAYNMLVRLNQSLSRIRRLLRRPGYWSLAGYAKKKVKKAVNFIFDFEDAVVHAARQRKMDGVVCGHIHWSADRMVEGIHYLNCGDWVDTCSGIVEHHDGRIEIVHWSELDGIDEDDQNDDFDVGRTAEIVPLPRPAAFSANA
ncbi:MAG TPA: UDP-2,3-diacylglucosamine diphosphatase [Azoarcus sp.]|nr:UDP-2,3-diacylglucosamine diphosphatase [Azoarcus sp.]